MIQCTSTLAADIFINIVLRLCYFGTSWYTNFFIFMFATASSLRFALCGIGGTLLLSGFVFLTCMEQDDARHNFGHSGGLA